MSNQDKKKEEREVEVSTIKKSTAKMQTSSELIQDAIKSNQRFEEGRDAGW